MFAFTLVVHGLINHYGVRLVALLNNTSVIVHIAGVVAIVGLVLWLAPLQPLKFLASAANFNARRPYAWAFLLGRIVLRHLRIARGILAGPRPRHALCRLDAAGERETRHARCGHMDRRGRRSRGHSLGGCGPIVTSLSTVALYLAYIIPVALGLRSRLRCSDWLGLARWTLGRWGPAVNLVAALYTLFICCVLIMPPNQLAAKTLAGVLGALGVIYVVEVRRKYRGQMWALELDRSFVRVHGVLRTHREFLQAISRRLLGADTVSVEPRQPHRQLPGGWCGSES
jgi:amino acid transporter